MCIVCGVDMIEVNWVSEMVEMDCVNINMSYDYIGFKVSQNVVCKVEYNVQKILL